VLLVAQYSSEEGRSTK